MIKKTVTYTDYNGVEKKEDFYFDFSKSEVMDMYNSKHQGFDTYLQSIIDEKDQSKIINIFKELVLMAYGEKSEDGKYFVKENPDGTKVSTMFKQSAAYPEIYMELAFDSKAAADFINGVFPEDLNKTIEKYLGENGNKVTSIAGKDA